VQEQYSCCGNADLIAGPGLDDQFARVEPGGGTPESYFKDARNDTIVMTYPPGSNIAGHNEYEAYGAATSTGGGVNALWFTGQEQVQRHQRTALAGQLASGESIMTFRKELVLLHWGTVLGVFSFAFLVLGNGILIFLPSALIVFLMALYTMSRQCPNCGEYVWKRRSARSGIVYWGGFTTPKACSDCESQFDSFPAEWSAKSSQTRATSRGQRSSTVRQNLFVAWVVLIANVAGGISISAITSDPRIAFLFRGFAVAVPFVVAGYLVTLRCDHCGGAVLLKSGNIGWLALPYPARIFPKTCNHCGQRLDI